MGEIEGSATDRICRELKVSRGNAWVLIHRAKAALRCSLAALEG